MTDLTVELPDKFAKWGKDNLHPNAFREVLCDYIAERIETFAVVEEQAARGELEYYGKRAKRQRDASAKLVREAMPYDHMTVDELILELQKYAGDTRVVMNDWCLDAPPPVLHFGCATNGQMDALTIETPYEFYGRYPVDDGGEDHEARP